MDDSRQTDVDATSSAARSIETSGDDRAGNDRSNAKVLGTTKDERVARTRGGDSSQHASPGRDAQAVLTSIFTEFAVRRRQEKVSAWMYLQSALAENAGTLCPHAVSLKDLIAAETNIEDMLKGQSSQTGESPAEYLEKFLNAPSKETTQ